MSSWMRGVVVAATAAVLSSGASAADKPWRHAVLSAKSDAGFAFMVKEGGFAERQGLKLELPQLQDDTLMLKALVSGEIDSYQGSPGIAIVAASKGIDVRIIGCSWPGLAHAVYSQGPVKSVGEMKGKSFGIASPGALPDLLGRFWLDANKIPLADVNLVALGSDPERFKALLAGTVDASIASIEFSSEAKAHGLNLLITGSDIAPKYVRLCETTTGKVIAERGDDLVRFLAADIQAHRHALADREAALALARQMMKVGPTDARASFMYDFAQATHAVDPDLSVPEDKFLFMQGLLIKLGSMTQPADMKKLLATDVHAKAIALAGKK